MHDLSIMATAVNHQIVGTATRWLGRDDVELAEQSDLADRDRGAVSLEQVLWFVAAGISVAVVATLIWQRITDEANTPINQPTAPTP